MRTRDLGIAIGLGRPGPLNAITDVRRRAGRARDDHRGRRAARRRPGSGPDRASRSSCRAARTTGTSRSSPGCHRLNGNGELTGLEWVRESGQLTTPIAITNTHSVGVVRDALVAASVEHAAPAGDVVVAARRRRDVRRRCSTTSTASTSAPSTSAPRSTRRPAGRSPRATSVAGRAWSATSSRAGSGPRRGSSRRTAAATRSASWSRPTTASARGCASTACRSAREIGVDEVPSPYGRGAPAGARTRRAGSGSIIVVVATDAPAAAPPVRAPRPARRPRHRAGRRDGRPHERRPVHRVRDRQRPARATTRTTRRLRTLRRPDGRRPSSSTRCSTRPSRRPRRRSSTRSSPPRR